MRLPAIVPLLLSLTAFILSMLCIFAGSKTGYLESANLLTLNTSMLGHVTLNTSKSSSSLLNSLENGIKGDINTAISDVARRLDIHDFYSAHLLDYCEGYYTPSAVANLTEQPQKNVTSCSNHTSFFHFDPATTIQNELKPGVNLTDLQWPRAIQDVIKTVEVASKAMFLIYCIGTAATGLALIGAIINVFTGGKLGALANTLLCLLAFMALCIASAVSTVVINTVVNTFNLHGNSIGIVAYKGQTFIGMTWAATILIVLAAFGWIFESVMHKRREPSYVMEGKGG